jgi:hypothetical protein
MERAFERLQGFVKINHSKPTRISNREYADTGESGETYEVEILSRTISIEL